VTAERRPTRARRIAAATAVAVGIAIPAEGLRTVAYRDPVGIPTICFGSTRGVQMGDRATVEQCHQLLSAEMREAVEAVDRCRPSLPTGVLAAFGDAAYNVGEHIACDSRRSTAARLLDAGELEQACRQLPRWNKARVAGVLVELPGLTKRRAENMRVCLDGVREAS
jgi:lysozyme